MISIDPGATGAIVLWDASRLRHPTVHPMPKTKQDLHSIMARACSPNHGHYRHQPIVMEDVGDGHLGNSMQSVVSFAKRRATLDTILSILGLTPNLFLYRPQEWQNVVQKSRGSTLPVGVGRLPKVKKKDVLNWVKTQVDCKVTLAHADAVAIGLYHLQNTKGLHHERMQERRAAVDGN